MSFVKCLLNINKIFVSIRINLLHKSFSDTVFIISQGSYKNLNYNLLLVFTDIPLLLISQKPLIYFQLWIVCFGILFFFSFLVCFREICSMLQISAVAYGHSAYHITRAFLDLFQSRRTVKNV